MAIRAAFIVIASLAIVGIAYFTRGKGKTGSPGTVRGRPPASVTAAPGGVALVPGPTPIPLDIPNDEGARLERLFHAAEKLHQALGSGVSYAYFVRVIGEFDREVGAARAKGGGGDERRIIEGYGNAIQAYRDAAELWGLRSANPQRRDLPAPRDSRAYEVARRHQLGSSRPPEGERPMEGALWLGSMSYQSVLADANRKLEEAAGTNRRLLRTPTPPPAPPPPATPASGR